MKSVARRSGIVLLCLLFVCTAFSLAACGSGDSGKGDDPRSKADLYIQDHNEELKKCFSPAEDDICIRRIKNIVEAKTMRAGISEDVFLAAWNENLAKIKEGLPGQ